MPIDEDYYRPIITNGAFNSNYIQYESMEGDGKDKNLQIKKYLDKIKPYLSDMINNHKTQGTWRIHSGNKRIEHKNQGEWNIQLTLVINFVSFKPDFYETCTMHTKSGNLEIMMGSKTEEVIKELFESLRQRYKKN